MKNILTQILVGMVIVAIPAGFAGYISVTNRLERIETKLSIFLPDKAVLTQK